MFLSTDKMPSVLRALTALSAILLATRSACTACCVRRMTHRSAADDTITACFWESWSANFPAGGRFTPDDIDGALCTHVVYCYADLNESTNRIDVSAKEEDYKRLQALKNRNAGLKITVATGGWNAGSVRYSKMVASRTARAAFISSVVELLRKYDFDGFDIDWRDPGDRGGTTDDKANYVQLCKEMKQEFSKFGWQLTVLVSGRRQQLDQSYDLRALSKHTDYFYVVNYDYHGAWDGFMGHTAPLYPRLDESGSQRELNMNFTVSTILSRGIPASKIVIGISLHGYIYHYADINDQGFGAKTVWDVSFKGPYTNDGVKMGYNELCEILQAEGSSWTTGWQDEHQVPYVSEGVTSITYENEKSINAKMSFAEYLGLRGAFVYPTNADDFSGRCGKGRFPLTKQIKFDCPVASPGANQVCGVQIDKRINTDTRIVGGKPSNPRDWPWMVALLQTIDLGQFCGGTLLTSRHVLTAAHCVNQFTAADLKCRVGEYDFSLTTDNRPTDFNVASIRTHEQYHISTQENDIAILRLERDVPFNEFVQPACLPPPDITDLARLNAIVAGWGTTSYGGSVSNVLREVQIPIWTRQACEEAYPGKIFPLMICAGIRAGGFDSCQGDSGGPLMTQLPGSSSWYVVGVVSWGIECARADRPGVYTRVDRYLSWIAQNSVN